MLNDPQIYDMELKTFLRKNEGKKEIDFINHEEKIRKESLEEIAKKTDNDFRIEIENDHKAKGKEIDHEHVEYFVQIKKEKTNQVISRTKNELHSLEIYKERLIGFIPKNEKTIKRPELNLSERYQLLDKLFNSGKNLRTLKIGDLKKYELLGIIFGCHKDNARDLMNGSYNSKDRDLTSIFDEYGLN